MEVPENNFVDDPKNSAQALDDLLGLLTELETLDKDDDQETKVGQIIQKPLEKKQESKEAKTSKTQPKKVIKPTISQDTISIKVNQLEKKVHKLEKKKMIQKNLSRFYSL